VSDAAALVVEDEWCVPIGAAEDESPDDRLSSALCASLPNRPTKLRSSPAGSSAISSVPQRTRRAARRSRPSRSTWRIVQWFASRLLSVHTPSPSRELSASIILPSRAAVLLPRLTRYAP
jgi:hypothetical protein